MKQLPTHLWLDVIKYPVFFYCFPNPNPFKHTWDTLRQSLSAKNQAKLYTTKASSSCQSQPKKFQLHRGSRKLLQKFQNLKNIHFRFFWKMGPNPYPQKNRKKSILGFILLIVDPKKSPDRLTKIVNMVNKRRHFSGTLYTKLSGFI